MTREHERLDRLMGLLASERRAGGDLRASVMRRLERGGAVGRGRRIAWGLALAGTLAVLAWIGVGALMAGARVNDLGEIGRRGASWIAPTATPVNWTPPPRTPSRAPRGMPAQAVAPWGRT